jgi:hypothetical protein
MAPPETDVGSQQTFGLDIYDTQYKQSYKRKKKKKKKQI